MTKKSGALARIGLFMAIARVLGMDAANREFNARKVHHHSRQAKETAAFIEGGH